MLKILLPVLVVLLTYSCASAHSGNYAVNVKKPDAKTRLIKPKALPSKQNIIISGYEERSLASKYFTLLFFTLENTTSKWIEINELKIDFGSPVLNSEIKILFGKKLTSWYRAASKQKSIKQYNRGALLGVIAAVGIGMASVSTDYSVEKLGALGAISAMGIQSVGSVMNNLKAFSSAKVVPTNHILSKKFLIPPGLFTQKWVALYTERPYKIPYVNKISLNYKTSSGEVKKTLLKFRSSDRKWLSPWQKVELPDSEDD